MQGGGVKAILLHLLSLIGYAGSIGLLIALVILTLSFHGDPDTLVAPTLCILWAG
jgi:hypothetical protein